MSGLLKSAVFSAYGLPFSRAGLDPGLVRFLPAGAPITLIDVGASSGEFTAAVERHCGIRRALLIEPQPERCEELTARFAAPRYAIRQCAVGDSARPIELAILQAHDSSSIFPAIAGLADGRSRINIGVRDRITVPMQTIDTLTASAAMTDVDLLKIDAQGAEMLVLKGAARTLSKVRMIWTEISFRALYEGGALFGDVHAFLTANGFRLYSLHDGFRAIDGELLQADALFLAPSVETSRL